MNLTKKKNTYFLPDLLRTFRYRLFTLERPHSKRLKEQLSFFLFAFSFFFAFSFSYFKVHQQAEKKIR